MTARLTSTAFNASGGTDDWRYLLGRVEATFRAGSPDEAAAFALAAVQAAAARPPDVNLRGPVVHLTVPDREPLVAGDVEVVRRLSALAAE